MSLEGIKRICSIEMEHLSVTSDTQPNSLTHKPEVMFLEPVKTISSMCII